VAAAREQAQAAETALSENHEPQLSGR
jgi:hypothetical protein